MIGPTCLSVGPDFPLLTHAAAQASKQLHTFIFHYNLALVDTATKFLMLFSNLAL